MLSAARLHTRHLVGASRAAGVFQPRPAFGAGPVSRFATLVRSGHASPSTRACPRLTVVRGARALPQVKPCARNAGVPPPSVRSPFGVPVRAPRNSGHRRPFTPATLAAPPRRSFPLQKQWLRSAAPRSEAISGTAPFAGSVAAAPSTAAPAVDKAIGYWLGGLSGMVFSMVVLGGVTRLTRSGLSMTDWRPQVRLLRRVPRAAANAARSPRPRARCPP